MITAYFWNGETIKIDCFREKLVVDDNFDETLSKLSFATYGIDLNISKWDKCRITFDNNSVKDYFIESVKTDISTYGTTLQKQYKIELIECLEITKHIFTDSLCFSNLLDNDGNPITRTIGEMLTRLNNQLYLDKTNIPFAFYFNPDAIWANITAPEKFWTERSLAEILIEIGDIVGGYPELSYNDELEKYLLNYRLWDDTSRAKYIDNSVVAVSEFSGINGHAEILSSNLKNMQNALTVTEPTYNDFQAVEAEEYTVNIPTDGSAVFKTTKPIAEIKELTFGIYDGIGWHSFTVNSATTPSLELFCVEYDRWRALPTYTVWGASITEETIDQRRMLYYKRNSNIIKNIGVTDVLGSGQTAIMHIYRWMKTLDPTYTPESPIINNELKIRIKYIPYESVKLKSYKNDNILPIEDNVNQSGNVIANDSMSKYMQGLVERMNGDYSVWQKKTIRNAIRYNSGEWLNGEIIVAAHHEYGATEVNSIYTTSVFNRRNEFVEIPHNLRIWEIPEDKIVDRNLHLGEIINVSINTPLQVDSGSMTSGGKQLLTDYKTAQTPLILAYTAFKSDNTIIGDADTESDNYGIITLHPIAFGKSIIFYWTTSDNASIGNRRYKKLVSGGAETLQNYIAYDEKAKFLNLKFSNAAPTSYIFDETKLAFTTDPYDDNANFVNTFPASNKKQFMDCVALFDFNEFEIEKDIRERISMSYQLDFIGKNNTIVYSRAIELNRLCNPNSLTAFKIYKNSAVSYGRYETKRHTDSTYLGSSGFTADSGGIYIPVNIGSYTNIAICDSDNNLLFATNASGTATSIVIYFENKKREFIKI